MNKIKKMTCEQCGHKAEFFLKDKVSGDYFLVDKNGVITGGMETTYHSAIFPKGKNVSFLSPAVQKRIEAVGGNCMHCEDETSLRIEFENGTKFDGEDQEAWKYFLAPVSATPAAGMVIGATIKDLKVGEVYRDQSAHPNRVSLERVTGLKSNSYHYDGFCVDLKTRIVQFYHKNQFNTTKQLRFSKMVLATSAEKRLMEYVEDNLDEIGASFNEPSGPVLPENVLKEIQKGVAKDYDE